MNQNAVTALRAKLKDRGLSGYVAYTPSNIMYLTGFRSYFVSEWWRMHGTVLAFVPADAAQPVTLVLSDFEEKTARMSAPGVNQLTYRLWVDLGSAEQMRGSTGSPEPVRPEQYDPGELQRCIQKALSSTNMASGVIGTDLPHLNFQTLERLRSAAPAVTWVDATDDLYALRLIKEEWEVDFLRAGVELSEAGILAATARFEEGMTAQDVRAAYQIGVAEHTIGNTRYSGYSESWVLPTIGGTTSAGYGASADGLRAGDLVKFDCGATVGGYRSDGGRTFAFKEAGTEAIRLHKVLADAQLLARNTIRPGAILADAYRAAMTFVHQNGYPTFNRGHVGHSVGIDSFHEEPPYISPSCTTVVREGMVFAVEVPTYTPDVGAIMIEDLIVVREHGAELLHSLPHELTIV